MFYISASAGEIPLFPGDVRFPIIAPTEFLHVSKPLKILIACGGTGGHLFPGIAVAEALKANGHDAMLLISEKKIDSQASAKYSHLRFERVQAVAKPATTSPKMLPFLLKLWKAIGHSKKLIRSYQPDAVLGMGGFTSLPPVYAGHKLGLKTFIHDSNARPGRANVLTSRFCTQVFLGLEPAKAFFPKHHPELTGTPVRPEILALPSREEAATRFGLDPSRPTIVVTGGSQGAQGLNRLCAEAGKLLPPDFQILHIAGNLDFEAVSQIAGGRENHKILGFCDQMPSAYAVADLVISRSGASSLTEIAIAGIPSILVPFPFAADDHQTKNAEVFAKAGAAHLIQQKDLDAATLAGMATGILTDLQTRERMAQAARALAIPDAADRVCRAIEATVSPS